MPEPDSPFGLRLPPPADPAGIRRVMNLARTSLPKLCRFAHALGRRTPKPWQEPASIPQAEPGPGLAPQPEPAAPPPVPTGPAWPDLPDRLWGRGFVLPGGEAEVLRLAGLLPLSPANTLLLLDAGPGGAAAAIAAARGCFIAAFETEPSFPGRAAPLLRAHGRRVTLTLRESATPAFRARGHELAMALEPLRHGGDPASLLEAIAAGLKTGGQMVMTEIVLGTAGEGAELLPRWLRVEGRMAPPPSESTMRSAFRQAALHVHVTEELGPRQHGQVLLGWANLCQSLAEGAERPQRSQAAAMVLAAEAWLLRLRLLELGRLRLLRWHASRAGT